MGMLRAELELIYDQDRRNWIFEEIKSMPKD